VEVSNQAIKQSSNQATKQPSNQAIRQSSNQATKQPSNQAIKQPSNHAVTQSHNHTILTLFPLPPHSLSLLQYYADLEGKQVADAMALQVLREEMATAKKTMQEDGEAATRRQHALQHTLQLALQERESALRKDRRLFELAQDQAAQSVQSVAVGQRELEQERRAFEARVAAMEEEWAKRGAEERHRQEMQKEMAKKEAAEVAAEVAAEQERARRAMVDELNGLKNELKARDDHAREEWHRERRRREAQDREAVVEKERLREEKHDAREERWRVEKEQDRLALVRERKQLDARMEEQYTKEEQREAEFRRKRTQEQEEWRVHQKTLYSELARQEKAHKEAVKVDKQQLLAMGEQQKVEIARHEHESHMARAKEDKERQRRATAALAKMEERESWVRAEREALVLEKDRLISLKRTTEDEVRGMRDTFELQRGRMLQELRAQKEQWDKALADRVRTSPLVPSPV
jgi:hypothetical protein